VINLAAMRPAVSPGLTVTLWFDATGFSASGMGCIGFLGAVRGSAGARALLLLLELGVASLLLGLAAGALT
jgi:hypothetical protein